MTFALSDASTAAVLVVSISAVIGPMLLAYQAARSRRIEARLGTPNGAGNVSEMLGSIHHSVGQLLDGQTGQDVRLAKIETRLARNEGLIVSLETRLDNDDRRLSGIEESCVHLSAATTAAAISASAVAGALDAARRHDDPQAGDPLPSTSDVEDNQ